MDNETVEPGEPLSAAMAETIESFSLMFEQFGFPRMAGRIFAFLILTESPYSTQSDLTELLQASNSGYTPVRALQGDVSELSGIPVRPMQVSYEAVLDQLEPSSRWLAKHFRPS